MMNLVVGPHTPLESKPDIGSEGAVALLASSVTVLQPYQSLGVSVHYLGSERRRKPQRLQVVL